MINCILLAAYCCFQNKLLEAFDLGYATLWEDRKKSVHIRLFKGNEIIKHIREVSSLENTWETGSPDAMYTLVELDLSDHSYLSAILLKIGR